MRRRPATRRTRITARGLEFAGALAVVYAVSRWSLPIAIGLAGVLLIVAAALLESGEQL